LYRPIIVWSKISEKRQLGSVVDKSIGFYPVRYSGVLVNPSVILIITQVNSAWPSLRG